MTVDQVVIGIDPGVSGYVAQIRLSDLSVKISKLGDIFSWGWGEITNHAIFIEKVQPRPSQALKGVVTSCVNYGVLKATMYWNDIEPTWITPQTWQKALGLAKVWKRPRGMTDEAFSSWKYRERKKWHKRVALELYPNVKATLKNADALLIAEYGRQVLLKESKYS